jgi:plastocyanin
VPTEPIPTVYRLLRGAGALALVLAALTACGGNDGDDDAAATTSSTAEETTSSSAATSSDTGAPAETQAITATEADFSISLDEDSLTAGTYEITVVNEGGATHDLVVEQDGEDIAESGDIAPDDSATFTVALEPGEYVFYCSIGNHRQMGMELTVQVT